MPIASSRIVEKPENQEIVSFTQSTKSSLANMIPAITLNPQTFAKKFPPGGKGKTPTHAASKATENGHGRSDDISRHPILNDVPTVATSCLIYDYDVLTKHSGDSTYPIPDDDEFKTLRKLKSLEAVVKRISPGNTVFSHMLVSPTDVLRLFGEDFMKEMRDIQRDVS